MHFLLFLSETIIPILIFGIVSYGLINRKPVYEDFIEGVKPEVVNEKVLYNVKSGIFREICENARSNKNENYVLIIDEINRGNVANIFGELITLIENDKREGRDNVVSCKLPYSGDHFTVPENLYIIGTMNTADRSVEALDSALRRRFSFVEMLPKPNLIKYRKDVFECINKRLTILKKSEYQLGHSYLMHADTDEKLYEAFRYKVIPLIQEYFYGDIDRMRLVLGDGFFVCEQIDMNMFNNIHTDIDIPSEIWRLWNKDEWESCKNDMSKFTKALEVLLSGNK